MNRLIDAFASLSEGGRTMIVPGDAGMGKTTLAEDFLEELESENTPFWRAGAVRSGW